MAHRVVRGLRRAIGGFVLQQQRSTIRNCVQKSTTRNYVSEMRKSAFEGNILRLIRNEIQYELDVSPPAEPTPEFNSFKVHGLPGQQWIQLSRKFGENEEIKVEVTMFDGSVPVRKNDDEEDVKLHLSLIVDVMKGEGNDVLEFVCSAWPDAIEIRQVYTRTHSRMEKLPYMGPDFKELDDELQNSLYDFLELRGIDDNLAEFLHSYMMNKDKTEYLRWMGNLKSFIEKR